MHRIVKNEVVLTATIPPSTGVQRQDRRARPFDWTMQVEDWDRTVCAARTFSYVTTASYASMILCGSRGRVTLANSPKEPTLGYERTVLSSASFWRSRTSRKSVSWMDISPKYDLDTPLHRAVALRLLRDLSTVLYYEAAEPRKLCTTRSSETHQICHKDRLL